MRRSTIVAAAHSALDWLLDSVVLRLSSRASILAVVLLGTTVGGTAAWWAFPPTAAAIPSGCDLPWPYNSIATNNTQNYSDYGDQVNGPGMNVYGGGAVCVRISSLESNSNSQVSDLAEVGWHIQASGYNTCNTTGDNKPHVFYAWMAYGSYACHEATSYQLTAGNKYAFSIRYDFNDPHTLSWIYDFQGNILTIHDNGFDFSQPTTNGERHGSGDGASAHFIGMKFRTASDTWAAWGHSACSPLSDDNIYNNQLISNTEIQVSQQAAQC